MFAVFSEESFVVEGTDVAEEGVWAFPNGTLFATPPPFAPDPVEPNGGISENCLSLQIPQERGLIDISCFFDINNALCETQGANCASLRNYIK